MNGYGRRKQDEEQAEGPVFCHKNRTVEQGHPDHTYRYNFDFQWDRLMHHKISDIWAKPWMIQEPVVQSLMAAQEKRSRQKQKRRRGKDGKENAENPKSERQTAQYRKKKFHNRRQNSKNFANPDFHRIFASGKSYTTSSL